MSLPTIVPYVPGMNAKYYVKRSGGFLESAVKSSLFVVNPNGRTEKVKRFLFFKKYPIVVKDAEVFVPYAAKVKNKNRITLAELSIIISALAIVSNAIVNLKKN